MGRLSRTGTRLRNDATSRAKRTLKARRTGATKYKRRLAVGVASLKTGPRISRYRGVHYRSHSKGNKFLANVILRGKHISAGFWPDQRSAAIARDRAALHLGLDVELNFPKESRALGPASPLDLRSVCQARSRKKRGKCPYIGVVRGEGSRNGVWQAVLGRKVHFVGRFDTPLEAALWRERAVVYCEGLGKNYMRNFPGRAVVPASIEELNRECALLRKKDSTSRYFGVMTHKGRPLDRPWRAVVRRSIGIGRGRGKGIGCFETEEEAAEAYDRVMLHHVGPKARLNSPERAAELVPTDIESMRAEARHAFKSRTTSRFRGVSWAYWTNAWSACIVHRHRAHRLGYFPSEVEAACAYDHRAIELCGEDARLNFHPVTGEELWGKRLSDAERAGVPRAAKPPSGRPKKRKVMRHLASSTRPD